MLDFSDLPLSASQA